MQRYEKSLNSKRSSLNFLKLLTLFIIMCHLELPKTWKGLDGGRDC